MAAHLGYAVHSDDFDEDDVKLKDNQTTATLLMIRPANFGFNYETRASNAFQSMDESSDSETIREMALAEFDGMVKTLREADVNVVVLDDTFKPIKPCAVFPDWITTFSDRKVILSSLLARSRRFERRWHLVAKLGEQFKITNVVNLQYLEEASAFIEGKGSMVLDRMNHILYTAISCRTHQKAVDEVCRILGYKSITFKATDEQDKEIYHTDVLFMVGETFAVICWEAIKNGSEREKIRQSLMETNKEIVEITMDQLKHFAGNILVCSNRMGEKLLVMSEQAFRSYRKDQLLTFRRHVVEIVYFPVYTIEKFGGGSAHCMTTEIFLPRRNERENGIMELDEPEPSFFEPVRDHF